MVAAIRPGSETLLAFRVGSLRLLGGRDGAVAARHRPVVDAIC